MNRRILCHRQLVKAALALLGAAAALPLMAAPQRYRLDPAHSFATFEVMHFGTSTLRGRFGPLTGEVMLDVAAGRGEVGLTIDTSQVNTGVRMLDSRLCAADLLDCEGFPQAYFVARPFEVSADGRVTSLRGEFTLRGVSEALTLTATQFGCYTQPESRRRVCGGDFVGEIRRSRFGATFGLPLVGDTVRLVVQVEGVAAEAP
ncbi:YceI family protein [Ideonella margarita]|uniref:YceI family protein n=1 Tax=Ideonella margarita TaxID=2984191 RepID=A0ABU9C932_9BURK